MICICPNCKEVFETIPQSSEVKAARHKKALTIVQMCVDHFDVTQTQLFGKHRPAEVVAARHAAMYLIRKKCHFSYDNIGKMFNRDHTTAIHAENRVKNSLYTKQDLYDDIKHLEALIEEPTANHQPQTVN
jgi:chromosomal replication initiator protein